MDRRTAAKLEGGHDVREAICLLTQAIGRRGGLLDHRGVLLGHLIHLIDGSVDLAKTGGLFLSRGGHLGNERINFTDLRRDRRKHFAGIGDQTRTLGDLGGAGVDQRLVLSGAIGSARPDQAVGKQVFAVTPKPGAAEQCAPQRDHPP